MGTKHDVIEAMRDAGGRAGRSAQEASGRRRPGPGRFLAMGALGAAIGAAAAFLLDPQRGRSRRAQLVDRGTAWLRDARRDLERGTRQLTSTLEGKMSALRSGSAAEPPLLNDAALAMKVQSELFRDADVAKGDVNVNVEQGVVVLRGEVADSATGERLGDAARAIPGVWEVRNLLHLPGEPAPTYR